MGFRTQVLRIPKRRFTVIVLINRNSAGPAKIAEQIAEMFLKN